ncbi:MULTISPECIES: preprotein translocase subunit SecE [Clavibacter]|uniref:Protein translocase subunit SecE n=12 Tax=Clavibacter TaxID=1573 RepID=A0A251YK73_9MICO|nr:MULTISPECIES: preprotein translocase subunit SecE [Clavibacter]MBF4624873.1 preprotein translocase subunit SecE [Clavibacter sp. VKM Ac-2872]AJW80141.1 preprotein translocase subunit SecE [Clavibacter michiganensis subsp. insidiosus]AWF97194.1 preprotein translocase subunit SecE [Clavibacter michiganensis subsp. insidiosus]AWG02719.1 preprotein translocase subunit SecE [Clavibacter michiganensis subsp. insidiosus]KAF0257690.1 preprotein translocase subunit SecE [Clavibacter michiganensis su
MARKIVDEPSEEIVAQAREQRDARRNPFARLVLFIKQVVQELKKVVTPTRKELLTFTGVVLAFVIVMMVIVSLLDQLFGYLAIVVFGNGA